MEHLNSPVVARYLDTNQHFQSLHGILVRIWKKFKKINVI